MAGILQSDDKAMTLCFVEFVDSKCALTALEALQGICFFWIDIIQFYFHEQSWGC